MQASVLKALEFDRVRELLAGEAATALGRARALALEPGTEPADIAARLALTTEALRFTKDSGTLAIEAPEDLAGTMQAIEIGEQALEPLALLGLARFVDSVASVVEGIGVEYRLLAEIAVRTPRFDDESRAIRRAIQPAGDVSDDASPALREIRDKLRRARARLRSTLEGLLRGRDNAKYLQDQIITDRNGRYVVVVRAEFRDAIPGLVHGSSASGASLYLEPLSTVEANNDVVALAEREAEEIQRILLALTNAFRRRADDVERLLDAAADLDELYAKARLAARLDAIAPALTDDGRLEFLGARHPLLRGSEVFSTNSGGSVPEVGTPGARPLAPTPRNLWKTPPTPSNLTIVPPVRALVISGPNTGGKTVALKAVGLLALMAQAGLLIPVDPGSRFTPFRSVFADIGDEQSISASLSTFSAHIANIVSMDRDLILPALVLLDEVGGGTDPLEGGALGAAVIDHFRHRGAIVVATTHDDAIKSFAATTEGVVTAAFGFNPETYAPTYRLIYGAPGRSLALEISERLGMPGSVIESARARRSGRESVLAEHLARVDRELAALDRERAGVEAERAKLADERQRVLAQEARVAEREAVLKRRLDDRLNEKLREAREEVDRIVGRLKTKAETLAERSAAVSTGDVGQLRVQGRAELESVASALGVQDAPALPDNRLDATPAVGDKVFVVTFGAEGIVRGTSGRQIDVEVRGKRLRVPLSELRRSPTASARGSQSSGPAKKPSGHAAGASAASTHPERLMPSAAREIVLIGSTVDEAVDRTEKFIDDALMADERRLRVVHGHGTGRLRDGLRAFLKAHPQVAAVSPAPENEGGGAATIVELKD